MPPHQTLNSSRSCTLAMCVVLRCFHCGTAHGPPHVSLLHRPCSYYKEELNEDVKAALAGALGAWLPRCAGMPDAALARLTGARVCVC